MLIKKGIFIETERLEEYKVNRYDNKKQMRHPFQACRILFKQVLYFFRKHYTQSLHNTTRLRWDYQTRWYNSYSLNW